MRPRIERDAASPSPQPADAGTPAAAPEARLRRIHGSRWVHGAEPERVSEPDGLEPRPELDELPEERPLTIEVNGRPVATLLCTPNAPAELAAGWALAQGFFQTREQLRRVTARGDRVSLMVDGPARCGEWGDLLLAGFDATAVRVPAGVDADGRDGGDDGAWHLPRSAFQAVVDQVFARFRDERGSGGMHHAAVADERRVRAIARDVSRHNAVDKVVGWALLAELDPAADRLLLFLSGRISADIVFKARRAGLSLIGSRSLPTREAVALAEAFRITLVGRALDARRAVYSHPWRLVDDPP